MTENYTNFVFFLKDNRILSRTNFGHNYAGYSKLDSHQMATCYAMWHWEANYRRSENFRQTLFSRFKL